MSDGKTLENELEVVEGMKFDRGYISPYFITDQKTMKCELENPLILICEKKISGLASLLPILEKVVQVQRPLLIIAEDVESEVRCGWCGEGVGKGVGELWGEWAVEAQRQSHGIGRARCIVWERGITSVITYAVHPCFLVHAPFSPLTCITLPYMPSLALRL